MIKKKTIGVMGTEGFGLFTRIKKDEQPKKGDLELKLVLAKFLGVCMRHLPSKY